MKDNRQQKIDSFEYPEYDPQDYELGAVRSAPFEIINESGDWRGYLPSDEIQRKRIDSNGCTNFGTLNILEILEKYKYGKESNYSERFQAVMSGQKRSGNNAHKVFESIRKDGVLDDDVLPFTDNMTFEEYLSPIPMSRGFINEARKWVNDNLFNHEYIYRGDITLTEKKELLKQALQRSPVGVSVYAWQERNGVYIKPAGHKDSHWCCLIAIEDDKPIIYDSYEPHLKTLTWDHFDVTKGVYLGIQDKQSLLKRLLLELKLWQLVLELTKKLNNTAGVQPLLHPLPKEYQQMITQEYGVPNKAYSLTGHHIGTDWAVPLGTPIYAPCDGVMTVAGYSKVLGFFCHYTYSFEGKQYTARFLHQQKTPKMGTYRCGNIIGRTGNSGMSTGYHLHCDVWVGDVDLTIINKNNWRTLTVSPQQHYGNN